MPEGQRGGWKMCAVVRMERALLRWQVVAVIAGAGSAASTDGQSHWSSCTEMIAPAGNGGGNECREQKGPEQGRWGAAGAVWSAGAAWTAWTAWLFAALELPSMT